MTVSEILTEYEMRRPANSGDYAGGMTEGDLRSIRSEAAELKAKMESRDSGAAPPQS